MSLGHAVIITGASKGFGRAAALSFAQQITGAVHFVLSARNEHDLLSTQKAIYDLRSQVEPHHYGTTSCRIVKADLSNPEDFSQSAEDLFGPISMNMSSYEHQYSSVIFVSNAGSLGPLSPIGSTIASSSEEEVKQQIGSITNAINVNVTASIQLTEQFVKRIESAPHFSLCQAATLVNISSLAAVEPFVTWGIYCAGKAARDMYHKILALEQIQKTARKNTAGEDAAQSGMTAAAADTGTCTGSENENENENAINTANNVHDDSGSSSGGAGSSDSNVSVVEIQVLNYAPGPLDTDMQTEIRSAPGMDAGLRQVFADMKDNQQLVSPQTSADKLARIVLLHEQLRERRRQQLPTPSSSNPVPPSAADGISHTTSTSTSTKPLEAVAGVFKNGDHIDYYDSIPVLDSENVQTYKVL